ncbi:MAG: hypothetical protein JOZ54_14935 [Acidobacteria bacterium]|nr:hypothetical protein [Acidobacteriota bacterium]
MHEAVHEGALSRRGSCVFDRFGAKPHLLEPLGVRPERMAVAYLDGLVVIVDGDGNTIDFNAGADVLDVALLDSTDATVAAVATPYGVAVSQLGVACARTATLTGHDGRVTGVALFPVYTYDERQVLIASADERGNVYRWGGRELRLLTSARIHRKTVHTLRSSMLRGGLPIFITASDDRDIVLHDAYSEHVYARLSSHVGWIEQIRPIECEGALKSIVVADRVGIMVWDVDTQRIAWRFRGRPRTAVAAMLDRSGEVIIAAGTDQDIVLARRNSIERLRLGDRVPLRAVALSHVLGTPVLWTAATNRLEGYDLEGRPLHVAYELPAPVLQLQSWTDTGGMLCTLEGGAIWSIRW